MRQPRNSRGLARQRGAQAAVVEAALIRQFAAASRLTTIGNQPPAQAEKQRILSASMHRAHRENSADSFPSLTPPRAGVRNPFELLITHLTEQTKPAQSLTPPRTEQP